MRHLVLVAVLLSLLVTSGACKSKRPERVAESYSSATRPTYPPVPTNRPQAAPVGVAAIPVEEDYEEFAVKDVTEANLAARLGELEAELAH